MNDTPRLIEVAFPLARRRWTRSTRRMSATGTSRRCTSGRRGARWRRAGPRLIATLLPDPGTPEARKELLEKIGGKVVTEVQKKKVGGRRSRRSRSETEGGVLHWGNENSPDMDWFREEIRKAYGGRAPRVLDPFAGGGAIPLEAMRLGLRGHGHRYQPRRLVHPEMHAGISAEARRADAAAAEVRAGIAGVHGGFLKGTGVKRAKKQAGEGASSQYQQGLFPPPEVDLAWHVRAWGWWVLQKARARSWSGSTRSWTASRPSPTSGRGR